MHHESLLVGLELSVGRGVAWTRRRKSVIDEGKQRVVEVSTN